MTLSPRFVIYVVVQFCPWFKFYFPLFWGMVMYDNVFKTKENKILIKNKIEPQHIQSIFNYQQEMFFKILHIVNRYVNILFLLVR